MANSSNKDLITFSSSSSPSPPPPPPLIPSGPGGSSGGGAGLSGKGRKKVEIRESPNGQKRKLGHMGAPETNNICRFCAKKFRSQNAVNGHMRVHSKQGQRVAFPQSIGDVAGRPPIWEQPAPVVGDQPALPEDPSVTVAKILLEMRNGVRNESSHGAFVTNIGLNKEPEEDSCGSSPPPRGGDRGFDLNFPPSPEKDDKNRSC